MKRLLFALFALFAITASMSVPFTTQAFAGVKYGTCEKKSKNVSNGGKFWGAVCTAPGGCSCKATLCSMQIDDEDPKLVPASAKCDPLKVDLFQGKKSNAFPTGCTPVSEDVGPKVTWHGVKCQSNVGCFCNAQKCTDGSYKSVSCQKMPE